MSDLKKCEFCDGKTIVKKVTKQHWHQGKLYMIENVKATVCRECGERYYHASVLDEIEKLISKEHEVKDVLSVEVLAV